MTTSKGNNRKPTEGEKDNTSQPGVALLTSLRKLMPIRRLAYYEHLLLAERQATRLLIILDQTEPGVSLDWLSDGSLGNIAVVLEPRWRMEGLAGMTTWADDRWVVGINKGQPQARRRFTLAHEFKHVLDAHRDKITYQDISPEQRERIADYFAACYLMPKAMIRRAWTGGLRDPEALAGLFKVSRQAMDKRLTYLQYIDGQPDRLTQSYFRRQDESLCGERPSTGDPGWIHGQPEDELDEPANTAGTHITGTELAA